MKTYKDTLEEITMEQMAAIDDYISEELSEFLVGLREQVLLGFPYTSKAFVEQVIDEIVENAAEWEWN